MNRRECPVISMVPSGSTRTVALRADRFAFDDLVMNILAPADKLGHLVWDEGDWTFAIVSYVDGTIVAVSIGPDRVERVQSNREIFKDPATGQYRCGAWRRVEPMGQA